MKKRRSLLKQQGAITKLQKNSTYGKVKEIDYVSKFPPSLLEMPPSLVEKFGVVSTPIDGPALTWDLPESVIAAGSYSLAGTQDFADQTYVPASIDDLALFAGPSAILIFTPGLGPHGGLAIAQDFEQATT